MLTLLVVSKSVNMNEVRGVSSDPTEKKTAVVSDLTAVADASPAVVTGLQGTSQLTLQDTEARVVLVQTGVVSEEPAGRVLLAVKQASGFVRDIGEDFQSIFYKLCFSLVVAGLEANLVFTPTVRTGVEV